MGEVENPSNDNKDGIGCLNHLLLIVFSVAVTIPLALFEYELFEWIPIDDFRWQFLIGSFVLFLLTHSLVLQFKYLVLFSIMAVVCVSFYQKHTGKQPMADQIADGYAVVLEMALANTDDIVHYVQAKHIETIEDELKAAADYMHPDVKSFANTAATRHFTENGDALFKHHHHVVRYFSVFKTINSEWKYVEDPKEQEYFAKASESIRTMAGDCDDHNALMTACIKAIGGEAQMVAVEGHIFPVVRVADSEFEFNVKVKPLVQQLFYNEYDNQELSIYNMNNGVWMNFDYTADYPGGPFMSDKVIKRIAL
jgi:hypothetical protein